MGVPTHPSDTKELSAQFNDTIARLSYNMLTHGSRLGGAIKYEIDISLPDEARTSLCHCKNCKVCYHLIPSVGHTQSFELFPLSLGLVQTRNEIVIFGVARNTSAQHSV